MHRILLSLIAGFALGRYTSWKVAPSGGIMTKARLAAHGHIMHNVHDPAKLDVAAQRFGQEGLPNLANQIAEKAKQVRQQAKEVPDLVARARSGDQNAMGMIAACRQAAENGSARAKVTCLFIDKYTLSNPVPVENEHGE